MSQDKHDNNEALPSSDTSSELLDQQNIDAGQELTPDKASPLSNLKIFKNISDAVIDISTSVMRRGGDAVSNAVSNTKGLVETTLPIVTNVAADISNYARTVGGEVMESAISSAKEFPNLNHEQWFGDDLDRIKGECDFLNDWNKTRFPTQVGQAALCAAIGAGILDNSTAITQFTRDLMDNDHGPIQVLFRRLFRPEAAEEISRWMDTVPGLDYAGGMFHRLKHGHDINALIQLVREHHITGAIEWFNHIALRDFWTPHGVPFLPSGSGTVFDWLVSLNVPKTTAIKLLSLNMAHVAGAILLYRSGQTTIKYIKEQLRERQARRLWDRAKELEVMGDYESADL